MYNNILLAVVQAASKEARLGREEFDVVSTSLPVLSRGASQIDAQITASVAAAGHHTTAAAAQPECTSADEPDIESTSADQSDVNKPSGRGATDPLGESSRATASVCTDKHVAQNSGLLTSFLGDYGSDSDDSQGHAT